MYKNSHIQEYVISNPSHLFKNLFPPNILHAKYNTFTVVFAINYLLVHVQRKHSNILDLKYLHIFLHLYTELYFLRGIIILWNHFYSLGLIFVGSQNFPCLWGHNFVGCEIRTFLINIKQMLVPGIYLRGYVISWARVSSESHNHWSPMDNDDSAVV